MAVVVQNRKRRSHPKLNKHFVVNHDGWDVYSVDASGVRNIALHDEEFGNFATHEEFPGLIPKGENLAGGEEFEQRGKNLSLPQQGVDRHLTSRHSMNV